MSRTDGLALYVDGTTRRVPSGGVPAPGDPLRVLMIDPFIPRPEALRIFAAQIDAYISLYLHEYDAGYALAIQVRDESLAEAAA